MKRLFLSLAGLFLMQAAYSVSAHKYNLTDSMLNKPAPTFSLKDINGKLVNLEDYRGKTVILDFWATWCVPCRYSFPAMKLLVNKYKNQPDVVFLFIDTREKTVDCLPAVKNFLKDTNYPFYVLLDERGDDGQMNLTYKKYVMPGIPTKYIIDPKGIIRFRNIGFLPRQNIKETVADITTEIEVARKY